MAASEHILDLIKDLVDNQVKFIVCGGVAVVLHGVERMTMDLDLSVDLSEENLKRLLTVIKKNNMTSKAPIPMESILDRDIRDMIVREKNATVFSFVDNDKPYKQIDIFITDDRSYDAVREKSEEIRIDEACTIRIASMEKLIEMKRKIKPVRDKDLYDIKALTELKKKLDG